MTVGRTLAQSVRVRGIGLFTAHAATVTITPAAPGDGIAFMLGTDLVPASCANLATRPLVPIFHKVPARHTCLASPGGSGPSVATIEHVMSALVGLGITDATVSCDGPEIPIIDGSAAPFVDAIRSAGINERGGAEELVPRTLIRIDDQGIGDGVGGWIEIRPRSAPGCSYQYVLEYPAPSPIAAQTAMWDGTPEGYERGVAPARTYCLEQEAVAMRSMGLFAHLTPRDMLVIGDSGPIDNTLRFADEPARHKLLDLIGDLALAGAGRPIRADIVACRSGHALAHRAARLIAQA
jgi:UDP-3-O-acyl N-acetylglucosamine deacetylase